LAKSFTGGIHPPYRKTELAALPIETLPAPNTVTIPLKQHVGKPCLPLVSVGDRVLMGQKIGDIEANISAPVHASVSGKVVAIASRAHVNGNMVEAIVIENDHLDEVHPDIAPKPHLDQLSPEEIISLVREMGIVGMGGGGFPTHVKLRTSNCPKIDTVLLNGAECEPYLTDDHRLMLEHPEKVIYGLRCLMKAVGARAGHIGIEDNKQDAIAAMRKACAPYGELTVTALSTKYPQGAELQLIRACLGKEVPQGKLPTHIGVIVNNVHTTYSIADSLLTGMPSVARVITVGGACVLRPGNLLVRVGTTFADILMARGIKEEPYKLISGGPMMGMAMYNKEVAVCKCTSGVLAISRAESGAREAGPCVRCAKCVDSCPMFLQPTTIAHYAMKGRIDEAEGIGALECRECGPCAYVCPSGIPLVQWIRLAKADIYARK